MTERKLTELEKTNLENWNYEPTCPICGRVFTQKDVTLVFSPHDPLGLYFDCPNEKGVEFIYSPLSAQISEVDHNKGNINWVEEIIFTW